MKYSEDKLKQLYANIKTGDYFVCNPKPKQRLFGRLTRYFGRSEFVHAGVFYYEGRTLMCAEARIKGDYSDVSAFVIEPIETRMCSLMAQYKGTHLIRPRPYVMANDPIIDKALKSMIGIKYSFLKAIPVALNLNIDSGRIVCSTVCENVELALGNELEENWHPSDVFNSGQNMGQIL